MNTEFLGAVFAVLSAIVCFSTSMYLGVNLDPDWASKAHLHGKPETKAFSGAAMATICIVFSMLIVSFNNSHAEMA